MKNNKSGAFNNKIKRLLCQTKYKVYRGTYYCHTQDDIEVDETLAKLQVQNLQIANCTLIEEQQFVKLNFGTKANPQYIKVNAQLTKEKIEEL